MYNFIVNYMFEGSAEIHSFLAPFKADNNIMAYRKEGTLIAVLRSFFTYDLFNEDFSYWHPDSNLDIRQCMDIVTHDKLTYDEVVEGLAKTGIICSVFCFDLFSNGFKLVPENAYPFRAFF